MNYVFKKKPYILLAGMLDFVGYLFFRPFRRSGAGAVEPRNILLIRLDHLGDVLYSTAVPQLLKSRFPGARVTCLVSSYAAPLFEQNPYIDDVWIYDPAWFSKNRYQKSSGSLTFGSVIRRMKEKKIDTAIGLRGDLRENLLMFLGGAAKRIGFGITGGGFLLTDEVSFRAGVHMSQHTLDLVRALGVEVQGLDARLYFSAAEDKSFAEKLAAWGLAGRKYLALQTEAGYPSKEWPLEMLKDFMTRFQKEHPEHRIVLIGVRPQKSEALFAACPEAVNLSGKISIRELCLLIRHASIFTGYDSGPSYIASTLGTPTLFLYSGTNVYEEWKPLQPAARVIRKNPPCAPCHREICNVEGHPCMTEITTVEAMAAVDNLLSRSAS